MKNRYTRCKSETAVRKAVERDCARAVSNGDLAMSAWYVYQGNTRIDAIRDLTSFPVRQA